MGARFRVLLGFSGRQRRSAESDARQDGNGHHVGTKVAAAARRRGFRDLLHDFLKVRAR